MKTINFLNSWYWYILPFVWREKRKVMGTTYQRMKLLCLQSALVLAIGILYFLSCSIKLLSPMFGFTSFFVNQIFVMKHISIHPALVNNFFHVARNFYGNKLTSGSIFTRVLIFPPFGFAGREEHADCKGRSSEGATWILTVLRTAVCFSSLQ